MLRLVIQQRRPPSTRFLVHFRGQTRAFNSFAHIKEWIHNFDFWESFK